MELDVITSALLRRWYLVMVGIAVTAGLVLAAYTAVPPTYSATGTSVVLPSAESIPDGANLLLQLGGLEQPASLVVAYLSGDTPREAFAEEYPDAQYDVMVDPLSRGPLIIMTVESPHEEEVVAALETALATVSDALAAIQDEVAVPEDTRLKSSTLIVDVEPTTKWSKSLRAMIAVALAGFALTLVAAVGADRLLAQRASRRKEGSAARDGTAGTSWLEGDGGLGEGSGSPFAGIGATGEDAWDTGGAGSTVKVSADETVDAVDAVKTETAEAVEGETAKVEDSIDDEVTAVTDADQPEVPVPETESQASGGWHVRVPAPER